MNRRAIELQSIGGAFKDKKVAEQKARENADSLFGAPVQAATVSSTSQSKSAQAELNEALDDLKRERTR